MEYVADLQLEGFENVSASHCICQINVPNVRITLTPELENGTSESLLASVRASIASSKVRINGMTPERLRLSKAEFTFGDDERLEHAELVLDARLPTALPFPFTPTRGEGISFEEAMIAAFVATQVPCVAAEIVETDRFWMFPIRFIGGLGSIVDRRTGAVTLMGSGTPREAWIWAWELGITDGSAVLEACSDPERLHRALQHVCRYTVEDYRRLPLTLPNDWRCIEPLYAARDSIRVTKST